MADRKENELTKANNFEYVRALDSNGNSIQISKSDLVSVLGGLLPLATSTNKGLMSSNDKNSGLWMYSTSGYKLYKMCQAPTEWTRSNAMIVGSMEDIPILCVISFFRKNGDTFSINIKWLTDKSSYIKFYKKENSLYVFFDISSTSPNTVNMMSKDGIEFISLNSQPDDSYTLIG